LTLTGHRVRQSLLQSRKTEDIFMAMLSDSRRRKIQAKQRKAKNALKREAKAAKRERNKAS
jgi:hypothetical protein